MGHTIPILLVEDDDGIATPLAAALQGAGYRVVRAATGHQALEMAAGGVAAVVLDLGPTSTAWRCADGCAGRHPTCRS